MTVDELIDALVEERKSHENFGKAVVGVSLSSDRRKRYYAQDVFYLGGCSLDGEYDPSKVWAIIIHGDDVNHQENVEKHLAELRQSKVESQSTQLL